MKKISFYSVYNVKAKGTSSAVFSDLSKSIKSLKFFPGSRGPAYKLIASSGSNILIIDLKVDSVLSMVLSKTIAVFSVGQINDFTFTETSATGCDLVCLGSEQQLGRIRRFEKMLRV